MRFRHLPHIFDQARLGYDTADVARHFVTSVVGRRPNSKWRPRKPEVEITIERNELATQFQRLLLHLRPCRTRPWHIGHWLITENQDDITEIQNGDR